MEPEEWEKVFKLPALKALGNDRKMEVAYHEAGHSLIDLLYGIMPGHVTIIPDSKKKTEGVTINTWQIQSANDLSQNLIEKGIWATNNSQLDYSVFSLMGGIIGGAFYSGKFCFEGAIGDLNSVSDTFLSFGISDVPDIQFYFDKTFEIIDNHLPLLEKIANDLFEKKTLKEDYFRDLYQKIPEERKIQFDLEE